MQICQKVNANNYKYTNLFDTVQKIYLYTNYWSLASQIFNKFIYKFNKKLKFMERNSNNCEYTCRLLLLY